MTTINCPHCNNAIELTAKVRTGFESKETDKPFTESKASDSLRNTEPVQGDLVNASQAKNLKSKVNIEGVLERLGEKRVINLKSGGTIDTIDAFLKDDSGEIKVTFWAEDVGKINNGTKIRITNGYTNMYKGEVSLTKGKWGKLEILS